MFSWHKLEGNVQFEVCTIGSRLHLLVQIYLFIDYVTALHFEVVFTPTGKYFPRHLIKLCQTRTEQKVAIYHGMQAYLLSSTANPRFSGIRYIRSSGKKKNYDPQHSVNFYLSVVKAM